MKNKSKKTRYCEYHDKCDRDEDCFAGEDCPVFKHNESFSSLRVIPFPKHRTKEVIDRQKTIDRIIKRAEKLNW
jgi:hypothetical protein